MAMTYEEEGWEIVRQVWSSVLMVRTCGAMAFAKVGG